MGSGDHGQRRSHTCNQALVWLAAVCVETVDRLILATPLNLRLAKLQWGRMGPGKSGGAL